MTNRELYNAVINGNITDEVRAKAREELAKLDARNASKSSKPTKTQRENEPIAKAIVEALEGGEKLSVDLATELGITVNKVNGIALNLWKEGVLIKTKVKVKGKGEMTAYSLAPSDEGEEATAEEVAEAE